MKYIMWKVYCILFVSLSLLNEKAAVDIPLNLSGGIWDEIGKEFMSYLNDELQEKVSNIKEKDGPIDLDSQEFHKLFNDSEKKEIELAVKKAFQPYLGHFMEIVSQTLNNDSTKEEENSGIKHIVNKTEKVPKQKEEL